MSDLHSFMQNTKGIEAKLRKQLQSLIDQNMQYDTMLKEVYDDEAKSKQELRINSLQMQIDKLMLETSRIQGFIETQEKASSEMKQINGVSVVDPLTEQLQNSQAKLQDFNQKMISSTQNVKDLEQFENILLKTFPSSYYKLASVSSPGDAEVIINDLYLKLTSMRNDMIKHGFNADRNQMLKESDSQKLEIVKKELAEVKDRIRSEVSVYQQETAMQKKMREMVEEELAKAQEDFGVLVNELKEVLQTEAEMQDDE